MSATLQDYCDRLRAENEELSRPSRILFVEDDPVTRALFAEPVGHFNCRVDYAANGIDGEIMACRNGYDLVFLDLNLPGKSGEDVFAAIHSHHVGSLPVVIFTGTFNDDAAERLDRIGFCVHIRKPINFNRQFMESMLRTFRIHER
jgi:DNA-binding response OmpR family regulator